MAVAVGVALPPVVDVAVAVAVRVGVAPGLPVAVAVGVAPTPEPGATATKNAKPALPDGFWPNPDRSALRFPVLPIADWLL